MQPIRRLYDRFSSLFRELAKFGTVGAVAFVVDFGGTNLVRYGAHQGPLTSKAVATVFAATLAYLANRYWTWRDREQTGLAREYFLFFVLNGIGLLISLLIIGFVEYTLKMGDPLSYNISLIIGTALGTLFRFWSYKKWVFLPPGLPSVDPHTGLPETGDDPSHEPSPDTAGAALAPRPTPIPAPEPPGTPIPAPDQPITRGR
ncbi:GtrA family protein [Sphaerisporangium corydalis]|uniref:GtrA family protein n=1 Tax=Sphaerisporangium corydalis TaxID=1441875 RepID=A0ABV9EAV6_9ACTN|nr:GtrA family protein [Sphaerisporangium corydalis]